MAKLRVRFKSAVSFQTARAAAVTAAGFSSAAAPDASRPGGLEADRRFEPHAQFRHQLRFLLPLAGVAGRRDRSSNLFAALESLLENRGRRGPLRSRTVLIF